MLAMSDGRGTFRLRRPRMKRPKKGRPSPDNTSRHEGAGGLGKEFCKEIKKMTNRLRTVKFAFAAAFIALLLPSMTASAQYGNEPWWRGGQNRNGGYNSRGLREAIRRVENRSDDFQDHVDSALDRSRYDDSRREDRINDLARQFRDASRRLKDRFSERDPGRSQNEARALVQLGSRISRVIGRNRLDSRTLSDWNEISSNLNIIADAYNVNFRDDDDYNRGGRNPRNGNGNRQPGWRWPF